MPPPTLNYEEPHSSSFLFGQKAPSAKRRIKT